MVQLIQDVYPYLLAFYLLDSGIWVRAGQLAFVSLRAGRFSLQHPGVSLLGLAPTTEVLLTGAWGVALDDRRLVYRKRLRLTLAAPSEAGEWHELPYEGVKTAARQGRRVLLNGSIEIVTPSAGIARHVARLIESLRLATPAQRSERVAAARATATDLDAFRQDRRDRQRAVARLRVWSTIAAALFLGVIPACLYAREGALQPLLLVVLPALLLVHGAVVVESVRLLRGAGFGWTGTLESLAPLLLFPPASAHAPSLVLRDLYASFALPTMAAALLDEEALAAYAEQELARLARERGAGQAPADLPAEQATAAWQRVLAGRGEPRRVAPRRTDPTAAAFCPLCRSEYRAGFERCRDCDEPLRPFD